jgi:DNA-binding NtrC family response regulator
MSPRLLLVDDHALFLDLTKQFLVKAGYVVDTAESGQKARRLIADPKNQYSLVVLDYVLDRQAGSEVAKEILAAKPEQFIIIYSNDLSRDAIANSWKAGAVEFVNKGTTESQFLEIVKKWSDRYRDNQRVSGTLTLNDCEKEIESIGLVGSSSQLASVARLVKKYRSEPSTVLILGESGTGKEKIARSLHEGNRYPFRAVNCASYNGEATLMESELFGIEKDSFTGASRDKKGVFEEVGRGTVFLDEIHTLSLKAQQKLLRVLQEKTVRPVGSTKEIPVHFRLVVAAKPNLQALIKSGEFLLDLYYRLNVLRIEIPPLRDRKEDILPLLLYFVARNTKKGHTPKKLESKTIEYLRRYPWPGNIRELENTIEQLCATVTSDSIAPDDLDAKFFVNHTGFGNLNSVSYIQQNAEAVTREVIVKALESSSSQRHAAQKLGLSPSTFHRLLKRHGLEDLVKGRGGRRPKNPTPIARNRGLK